MLFFPPCSSWFKLRVCFGPGVTRLRETSHNTPSKIMYHWGLYRDNGKENGNYYIIIGILNFSSSGLAGVYVER